MDLKNLDLDTNLNIKNSPSLVILSSNCPAPSSPKEFSNFIYSPFPGLNTQTLFLGQEITCITKLFSKNLENLYYTGDFASPKRQLVIFSPHIILSTLADTPIEPLENVTIEDKRHHDYYIYFPANSVLHKAAKRHSHRSKTICISGEFSLSQCKFKSIILSSHFGFYKLSKHTQEITFSAISHFLSTDIDFLFFGIDSNQNTDTFKKSLQEYLEADNTDATDTNPSSNNNPHLTSTFIALPDHLKPHFSSVDCLIIFQVSQKSHQVSIKPLHNPEIPYFPNEDTNLQKKPHPILGALLTLNLKPSISSHSPLPLDLTMPIPPTPNNNKVNE